MLQRYKKNRTSASFLLTKCATFLIKCYWGTFSVPSAAAVFFVLFSGCSVAAVLGEKGGEKDELLAEKEWILAYLLFFSYLCTQIASKWQSAERLAEFL